MSLAAGFPLPVLLGIARGVAPAVLLWSKGSSAPATVNMEAATQEVAVTNVKVAFK